MSPSRTFKLTDGKPMRGDDVKEWQKDVKSLFNQIGIKAPIKVDGTYGQATRAFTASLLEAYGLVSKTAMKNGVTPELRTKMRHKKLTAAERKRMDSKARKTYRAKLRDRWHRHSDLVHAPVTHVISDDWDYRPGHDGIDVIAREGAAAMAMVKAKVIDARPHGWWKLGAPADRKLRERGDGIVQLQVLENNGPFKKGDHIGYGHVVHPSVKVGDIVDAGDVIGKVGYANAGHIHLMLNDGSTSMGIGNKNPRAILDYSLKHG